MYNFIKETVNFKFWQLILHYVLFLQKNDYICKI